MTIRPKLAVWKFTSCDGCQLSLLNLEDELFCLAEKIEIAYFLEISRSVEPAPYDLSLVEGSITTQRDKERIKQIRAMSKTLVSIGACATSGGIQALRNFSDIDDLVSAVYAKPDYIETLKESTAISDHITVDFELRGCPVSKHQILELIIAYLTGRKPVLPRHCVCMECKERDSVCVLVAQGKPCLGPITQAGCGAICPSYSRGCYGCFGPQDTQTLQAFRHALTAHGLNRHDIMHLLSTFNAWSPYFRKESTKNGAAND